MTTTAADERPAAGNLAMPELKRSHTDKPPFTLADIKRAIPPHCFQRSVARSSSYLLRDLASAAALLYLAVAVIPALPAPLRLTTWPAYWAAQGCALGGAWVLAHECGHHAFSEHSALDDVVGFALHTALLVPNFSWKHSHRRHHANSASLDRDEVFVPRRKHELSWYERRVVQSGGAAGRLAHLALQLAVGWPLYLACNAAGRPYPRFASRHFDPYSPIFSASASAPRSSSPTPASWPSRSHCTASRRRPGSGRWRVRMARRSLASGERVAGARHVPACSTRTRPCRATTAASGTGSAARWRRWTATTARSSAPRSTTSPTRTSCATSSRRCRTTTPMRQQGHKGDPPGDRRVLPVRRHAVARAVWRAARECVYVEPDGRREGVFWYGNKL
ncbi:unnamed protein product [Urochloa decumbens]|uniref:Fatty acid desaturase DES2 n=1 Tax=Urochloa decumbens TaxID=240449 RepID=A0ABC9EA56_9POAL